MEAVRVGHQWKPQCSASYVRSGLIVQCRTTGHLGGWTFLRVLGCPEGGMLTRRQKSWLPSSKSPLERNPMSTPAAGPPGGHRCPVVGLARWLQPPLSCKDGESMLLPPKLLPVWCEILPPGVWQGGSDATVAEWAGRSVNTRVSRNGGKGGGRRGSWRGTIAALCGGIQFIYMRLAGTAFCQVLAFFGWVGAGAQYVGSYWGWSYD